jgi:hypothetical protein
MEGWGSSTSNNFTVTSATTTGIYYPMAVVNGPVTITPTPTPPKRTPLEWLDDEVERICALTREGLAA